MKCLGKEILPPAGLRMTKRDDVILSEAKDLGKHGKNLGIIK